MSLPNRHPHHAPPAVALLFTVFVIGTCGLIYELLASTLASYVLGDSVTQFSTVIGVYLFAMGVGAWVSGAIQKDVCARFVETEIAVALVGGCSGAVLFLAFAHIGWFRLLLYGFVFVIGLLVGLEIPLLMRILQDRYELKSLVSRVLTADYLGALLASLAFPLFLVPKLGLIRGAFVVGLVNALVGVWCTYLLRGAFLRPRTAMFLRIQGGVVVGVLLLGTIFSETITSISEDQLYSDPIIYAKQSPYQRVVMTRGHNGFNLYLNGHLQFTSYDEHRYHEMLVHPAFAALHTAEQVPKNVLILGGGDGLALREVLRYPQVKSVTLVDLDPAVTELAQNNIYLKELNRHSLSDPRVDVVNADAMVWLNEQRQLGALYPHDVVIVDFPDPSNFSIGKLYTTRFYRLAKRALAPDGVMVIQSTSPMYARKSYWCVEQTLKAVELHTLAYHVAVPSFGEWGFFLAANRPLVSPRQLAPLKDSDRALRYINHSVLRSAFVFPLDMERVLMPPNRLDNQVLVQTYEMEWAQWQ